MKYFLNFYCLYANMDKNNTFLFLMIILIIFLLVLMIILNYIAKVKENKMLIEKRKEYEENIKKNIDTINKDKKLKSDNISSINFNIKEEEIEKLDDSKDENEDIEVIQTDEVSSIDEEIENIKKSIKETKENNSIKLNKWEQEQEESAIISYDELVKRAGAKKIIYKPKKVKEENIVKTFKPSKIVSPVYGVQENIKQLDEQIDSFNRIEKLKVKDSEKEMENDVEFLNSLKKLRSELN